MLFTSTLDALRAKRSGYLRKIHSLPFAAVFLLLAQAWGNAAYAVVESPETVEISSGILNVQFQNGLTSSPLPEQRIWVYERMPDGSNAYRGYRYTDAGGNATFELEGLGSGATFFLRSRPYNNSYAYSQDISQPGDVVFNAGTLEIRAIGNVSGEAMPGARLQLRHRTAEGENKYVTSLYTDELGIARFTPDFNAGGVFLVRGVSELTGEWRYSGEFDSPTRTDLQIGNDPIYVSVKDALNSSILPDQKVYAYELLSDGSTRWAGWRLTDDNGVAAFDLYRNGNPWIFKTRKFTGWAYSQPVENAGSFDLLVGTLELTVHSNLNGEIMPEKKVYLYRLRDDDSLEWGGYGYTDTGGKIRFSPKGLGTDGRPSYVVRTKSPINGRWHQSEFYTEIGSFRLQAGFDPTRISIKDVVDGSTPANQKVYSHRLMDDGSKQWTGYTYTDANGQALFDLPPSEHPYIFQTHVYGMWAYSDAVTEAGDHQLPIGGLHLKLLSNIDASPMMDERVYLYRRLENGESEYVARGQTDGTGLVRFSPYGLGSDEAPGFFAKARSAVDGRWRESPVYADTGAFDFTVGNAPIIVNLKNALSGDALTNTKVHLLERLPDGSQKWRRYGYTDESGSLMFDIEGVGEKHYFAKAKVYGTGYAYSQDITQAGPVEFAVGTLQITLVSNLDGEPLPSNKVYLYQLVEGEESPKWRAGGYTDANGVIRFTPYGLGGDNNRFVIRARSPVNGNWRYSEPFSEVGAYTHQAGNDPLHISVINGVSGNPVEGAKVYVLERVNEDTVHWRGYGYSDENGKLVFDIESLGNGNTFFLKSRPYHSDWAYNEGFTEPGDVEFKVGTLQLRLISNIDASIMPGKKVYLYRERDGEDPEYAGSAYSDNAGEVRFSPFGLGDGTSYFAKAQSPVNGHWRHSESYQSIGAFDFQVGFDPLKVTLVNGVSNAALQDAKIYAIEVTPNGEDHWQQRAYTNDQGIAMFDLPGFGEGSSYKLYTKPYNAGGVYSPLLPNPSPFLFRVGTTPVTLIDGDTNSPLLERSITAYRKLPNGDLQWVKRGYTDATGTVHFDLDFSDGNPFVFYAKNLFGEYKRYYSQLVSGEGPVQWIVTLDGDNTLDLTPPEINITAPLDGDNVTENGFVVSGLATDNRTVESVVLNVQTGAQSTDIDALYDPLTSSWNASVEGSLVNVDDIVILTATATDRAQNSQTATATVTAVADTEGPVITVTSHADGDSVAVTGFLLSGTATDLTGVASMTATISDPLLGDTQRNITVAANGSWTVRFNNGEISEGETVTVNLDAADNDGNSGNASISLGVVAVDYAERQLINRITFGATPALLAEVEIIGVDGLIAQQLNPATLDTLLLQSLLGADPTTREELQAWTFLRMAYSPQQLLEVMTWFWDNHFNTSIDTTRTDWQGNEVSNTVAFELAENQAFRANALGNFRDLLGISARSPSMLIYLDSISNVAGDSNENYSREIQELHTLGVGNFSESDVEAGAAIFTGWHLDTNTGQFVFNASQHTDFMDDGSVPVVLGNAITETGEAQGDRLLDILSTHPSTANYICFKLIEFFISDDAPDTAVQSCATTFLSSASDADQMTQVLSTILSNEFFDPANYRAKIKTPVEFVIGALRNLQGVSDGSDLALATQNMGLRLYQNPVPTGYSEVGADWINSSLLIERIKWANDFSRRSPGGSGSSVDPVAFFQVHGYFTNEAIVDFLLLLTVGDDFTDLTRQQALSVFGAYQMDLSSPVAGDDALLRQLLGTVMSIPQYQFQ